MNTDNTPNDPIVTPSDPIVTPSDPIVTPSDPIVTPSDPIVTPSDPIVTPSDPIVTPSDPIVTPSDPIVTPSDTNSKYFIIKITRYELYPIDEPYCYVVGFIITCIINKKNKYFEIQVPLKDIKSTDTEIEITNYAWNNLSEDILPWCEKVKSQTSSIIFSDFVPSNF